MRRPTQRPPSNVFEYLITAPADPRDRRTAVTWFLSMYLLTLGCGYVGGSWFDLLARAWP